MRGEVSPLAAYRIRRTGGTHAPVPFLAPARTGGVLAVLRYPPLRGQSRLRLSALRATVACLERSPATPPPSALDLTTATHNPDDVQHAQFAYVDLPTAPATTRTQVAIAAYIPRRGRLFGQLDRWFLTVVVARAGTVYPSPPPRLHFVAEEPPWPGALRGMDGRGLPMDNDQPRSFGRTPQRG